MILRLDHRCSLTAFRRRILLYISQPLSTARITKPSVFFFNTNVIISVTKLCVPTAWREIFTLICKSLIYCSYMQSARSHFLLIPRYKKKTYIYYALLCTFIEKKMWQIRVLLQYFHFICSIVMCGWPKVMSKKRFSAEQIRN